MLVLVLMFYARLILRLLNVAFSSVVIIILAHGFCVTFYVRRDVSTIFLSLGFVRNLVQELSLEVL